MQGRNMKHKHRYIIMIPPSIRYNKQPYTQSGDFDHSRQSSSGLGAPHRAIPIKSAKTTPNRPLTPQEHRNQVSYGVT